MPEKIQIVDEHDQPVGSATRQEAWAKGLYARLVHVVIEDEKGDILLQKRSTTRAIYPGCWTNAATGHVDEGETYEAAALRELQEEIGVGAELEPLGTFLLQKQQDDKMINQFIGVFRGHVPHDTQLTLDAEEVSEARWFTKEELLEKSTAAPEEFTPSLLEVIQRHYA
jgi:isopentenyldiphosphate isomerase